MRFHVNPDPKHLFCLCGNYSILTLQYRCYSVSMMPGNERSDVEAGGKIIMPPSALDQLTRYNSLFSCCYDEHGGRIFYT
jgi:hypothetical protein